MSHHALISTAALAAHLADPNWVVIDCRFALGEPAAGERDYRAGHIPGARYADLERDLAAPITAASGRHPLPPRERLAAALGGWGVAAHSQVVVYDDAGGVFASRLWWLLRWLGHEAVAVLDGGLPQWRREGRPLTAALPVPVAAAPLPQRAPLAAAVDAAELQAGLAAGTMLLIDARAAERFRGDAEPIDAVAGHVPGAVNRPWQANVDESGLLRPAVELRHEFCALLGARAAAQAVHMCGSGVTACHNLLAMAHAGLDGARLYPGSWSEWIRDPARPVARGPA